jgi:hypothetical protein
MTADVYHYIFNNPACCSLFDAYFSHPTKVCMSYFQHMIFSLYICKKLFVGSVHALVHAFYPDCFVTSSSDLVVELQQEMSKIGCREH